MATVNKIKTWAESLMVFVFDIGSLFFVFRLSVFMRTDLLPAFYRGFPSDRPSTNPGDVWWMFLVWLFFYFYEGLYTKRFAFWDEIKALWKVAFFSTAGIFTIVSIGKLHDSISRTVVILMGMTSIAMLPTVRMLFKKFLRRLGLLKRRVLILGAGATGCLIANALRREPNYGYEVIGFLDDDPEKIGTKIGGVKVHKGVDRASAYLATCDITDLFIAMPGAGKERLRGLVNDFQHKVERLLFVPDIFGVAVLGTNLQHFSNEEAFALEVTNNLAQPLNVLVKRCFDLIVSVLLLPLLFFPMIVVAVLIKLDSRGQVIFSQERVGKGGRIFRCFKFRTMHADAEERLRLLLERDPKAREEWEEYRKLKDDPRVTRMGSFLRATSLDELPQIFNALKCQMSLVGPRPVTQEEIETYYKETAELCFSVLPGITGLWQVSGRSNETYDYRIALDQWYVRNWNLWLDVVILFKTVRAVVKREGAC